MQRSVWKYLVGVACVVTAGGPARADGKAPQIEWPGWRLQSSEPFGLEGGSAFVSRDGRVRFPMANLIDGDPSTAWVWRDVSPKVLRAHTHLYPNGRAARFFTLQSKKPVVANELRIMSGYNRRPDLFHRNDRVVQIRISLDEKPIKTVALADRMGWHSVSLPPRAFRSLKIELVGIRKGAGADNDICLSELALFNQGRKVSFGLPRSVVYTLSYCCGGTAYLLSRGGRVLSEATVGDGFDIAWSPSRRFLAGIDTTSVGRRAPDFLWIADVGRGRIVQRHRLPDASSMDGYAIRWASSRALELKIGTWGRRTKPANVRRKIITLPKS